jgi:hypothetical protein
MLRGEASWGTHIEQLLALVLHFVKLQISRKIGKSRRFNTFTPSCLLAHFGALPRKHP